MAYDENDLQRLFDAAQSHGVESSIETELEDVVNALKAAYELLSPELRVEFFASRQVEHIFESADDGEGVSENEYRCTNCSYRNENYDFVPTDGTPVEYICPHCGSLDVFPVQFEGVSDDAI